MSLLNVIRRYATGAITVQRTAAGPAPDGQYSPGAVTTFTTDPVYTSVQPISGEELKDLPEGQRTEDTWFVWTTTLLFARSDTVEPDHLVGGVGLPAGTWRVDKVEGPFRLISGHYRATVSKVDIQ